jgi:hypothetical protein
MGFRSDVHRAAHNIGKLNVGHQVRLHQVPNFAPLLVRIGIRDQVVFCPPVSHEAETEWL